MSIAGNANAGSMVDSIASLAARSTSRTMGREKLSSWQDDPDYGKSSFVEALSTSEISSKAKVTNIRGIQIKNKVGRPTHE